MASVMIDPGAPDPEVVARAAELLKHGELVAVPTETVYGLGANALDERAVARIFEVKGRPSLNPLIVHAADTAAARALTTAWPEAAAILAAACWPGPLTMVLPKQSSIPANVTAGLPTVAIRVPRHPVMQAVLLAAGVPIAAPSANRSGEVSPTTAQHVVASLGNAVQLVLDAGPTEIGLESTVIDLSGSVPVLLRPGAIQLAELTRLIGNVRDGTAEPDSGTARPSPGMLDRHYAPKGELRVAGPNDFIASIRSGLRNRAPRIGVVALTDPRIVGIKVIRLPGDPVGYGRGLYAALRRLDEKGCTLMIVERPPERPEWAAIHDRLRRASRA